jgi:hypothetical protein
MRKTASNERRKRLLGRTALREDIGTSRIRAFLVFLQSTDSISKSAPISALVPQRRWRSSVEGWRGVLEERTGPSDHGRILDQSQDVAGPGPRDVLTIVSRVLSAAIISPVSVTQVLLAVRVSRQ